MYSGKQQPTCQLHWQSSAAANGEQEDDQADSGDQQIQKWTSDLKIWTSDTIIKCEHKMWTDMIISADQIDQCWC